MDFPLPPKVCGCRSGGQEFDITYQEIQGWRRLPTGLANLMHLIDANHNVHPTFGTQTKLR